MSEPRRPPSQGVSLLTAENLVRHDHAAEVYAGVYTTSPSLSCSTSAYTVDSRCDLLRRPAAPVAEEEEEEAAEDGQCRPRALQRCATIHAFIVNCCVFSTVSGALIAGYVNSVITTIEKRFDIASSHAGLIAASVEFGSLLAVLFVSYFGGSRNIPRWIGCGALLQGLGAVVFTLPHFLSQSYTVTSLANTSRHNDNFCRLSYAAAGRGALCGDSLANGGYPEMNTFLLVAAQAMIGIGGAPLFTLGTTYIDDHVPKERAPAYIAFLYATGALGPVLGFALGALMLQFYVDYFSFDYHRLHLTPDDPRWVGAWWGGFLVCGVLLCLTAVPFFSFPKVLYREKRRLARMRTKESSLMKGFSQDAAATDLPDPSTYGKDIKDLPASLWRLIANPLYVVTCLGICCEVAIVCGFVVFLPKYLETQFGISKSFANLLTGCIAIPGAVIGILVGGYLCKRCQLAAKGALQLTLTLNFVALATCAIFFLLGCDNVRMAGATLPYLNSSGYEMFEANLTSVCNLNCDCSPNAIEPVCGINGINYFSPCHAGCTQLDLGLGPGPPTAYQNYTGCRCILEHLRLPAEVTMSPLATRGLCQHAHCHTLLPFILLLGVMTFVVAGTQMPLLMMTLRAVGEVERAFALGIQFVLLRLFAYIPAPILYGGLIDSTCLLWNERCGGQRGSCLLYDIELFRFKYVGISAALKFLGILFFVLDWLLVCRNTRRPGEPAVAGAKGGLEGEAAAAAANAPLPQITEVMCTMGSLTNLHADPAQGQPLRPHADPDPDLTNESNL